MGEIQEKIILGKGEDKKLLQCKVKRGLNGVEVFVQSEILEDFFSTQGLEPDGSKWCNHKPYQIPIVRQHYRELFNNWYGQLTIRNGQYANLSFLRGQGLKNGITFVLSDNVYSRDELMAFIKKFKEEANQFFEEYIKPINMEVELITRLKVEEADGAIAV